MGPDKSEILSKEEKKNLVHGIISLLNQNILLREDAYAMVNIMHAAALRDERRMMAGPGGDAEGNRGT